MILGAALSEQPVNLVVISATPSTPQGVTVTPKLSSLLVSWSPSATNGGSEISKYLVTDQYGNTCMTDQTSCVLSGQSLVNSAIDTVTVVGVNLDGLSSESSAPVTGVTGSLPDAPTGLHASGGKKKEQHGSGEIPELQLPASAGFQSAENLIKLSPSLGHSLSWGPSHYQRRRDTSINKFVNLNTSA